MMDAMRRPVVAVLVAILLLTACNNGSTASPKTTNPTLLTMTEPPSLPSGLPAHFRARRTQ